MPGIRLSPSTLNLFRECPRCFWRQLREKVSRPTGAFPSLPTGMDSVLRKYFDRYRGETLPPLVQGRIPGRLAPEYPKTMTLALEGGATLVGKLDDLLMPEAGLYAPLDHKTRGSPPKTLFHTYQLQMDTYAWLLEANGFPISGKAYLVYYFPLPGELHEGFPFGVEAKELAVSVADAKAATAAALACLQGGLPKPAPRCAYCLWTRIG